MKMLSWVKVSRTKRKCQLQNYCIWMRVGGFHGMEAKVIEWEYTKEPGVRMLNGLSAQMFTPFFSPPNNQNEGDEKFYE